MRRQREEEDYWDEYEDFSLDSSSEESDGNESSPDQPSSDGEEEKVIEDSKRGEDIREGLGDDEGGVQLEIEERIFEPKWKSDAGGYLRGVRGCGLSATETRENRRKKELKNPLLIQRQLRICFQRNITRIDCIIYRLRLVPYCHFLCLKVHLIRWLKKWRPSLSYKLERSMI